MHASTSSNLGKPSDAFACWNISQKDVPPEAGHVPVRGSGLCAAPRLSAPTAACSPTAGPGAGLGMGPSVLRLPGRQVSSMEKFEQIMTLGLRYSSLGTE